MSKKVHYSSEELWGKERWVLCGQRIMREGGYTTNPLNVTCKECKRMLTFITEGLQSITTEERVQP